MSISNRLCPQCAIPNAPNAQVCSNCGRSLVESTPIEPTQLASPSYAFPLYSAPVASSIEPTQYADFPSTNPYESSPYGSTLYETPSYSMTPPPPAYAPPLAAAPYGGVPGAPGPHLSSRKGPHIGLMIGAAVLLLALVGGGIFFFAARAGKNTTASNTPPAMKGSTPVATAQPTPQALFSDNFSDNSSGWKTGNGVAISNNMLTMADHTPGLVTESLPTSNSISDFEVTFTFTLDQADQNDATGIVMRADDKGHDYYIDLYGDQKFDIGKDYVDTNNAPQTALLVPLSKTSALHPVGQQNTATVIMKGSKLVLLINNSVVESISDSDYTTGQLAFFVLHGNTSKGVQVSFNSVAVYPAPDQLPS